MRLLLLPLASVVLFGADWPQFRGPNGAGVAEEGAAYPDVFRTIWKADVPAGLSSPVVMGSRVFVTGLEGERFALVALDRASGKP